MIKWFKNQSRKRKMAVIAVFPLIFLCLCVTLPYIDSVPESTETSAPIEDTSLPAETPVPPTTTPAPTWHEIAQWEGKGIKNTETFHIPSHEWRISWDTGPSKYGNFAIFVYDTNGNMVSGAANVMGKDHDWSIMRGAGGLLLGVHL